MISREQPMRQYLDAIGSAVEVMAPDGVAEVMARLATVEQAVSALDVRMEQAEADIEELKGRGGSGIGTRASADGSVTDVTDVRTSSAIIAGTYTSTASGEVV